MSIILNASSNVPQNQFISSATLETFVAKVIQASNKALIAVDFWAPWCEPCRQLTPLLEKITSEAKGAFHLVKINVDDSPEIAQQLGIRSLPTVMIFKDGKPIDGFSGALSAGQIKAFFNKMTGKQASPFEETFEEALAAFLHGDIGYAMGLYSDVLQQDKNNTKALIGLARCYLANGDLQKAKSFADCIPESEPKTAEYLALKAAIELAESTERLESIESLKHRVFSNPMDWDAHFSSSLALFHQGRHQEALDHLFLILKNNREWNNQAARKQLLKFFEIFGPDDARTIQNRRQMSAILYS